MPKIFVTLTAIIFLLLIPMLEVNETHVFNPLWPGHARLHEVWQLFTHGILSIAALILVWTNRNIFLGVFMSLSMTTGFILAIATSGFYAGTMKHTDGSELAVQGMNVAVILMLFISAGLIAALFSAKRGAENSDGKTGLLKHSKTDEAVTSLK